MEKYKFNKLKIYFSCVGVFFLTIAFAQQPTVGERIDSTAVYERGDGGKTTQLKMTGAVNEIQGEALKTYPDLILSNTLQGRAAGLIVRQTNNGVGNNVADLFIRGRHRNGGNDQAIVVIDGIERDVNDLISEEIESITILKDASTKIFYGPAAANGVIVVKTKRGKINPKTVRLNAELGVMQATKIPKFLNAYDYATLYNEARRNDGFPDFYLPYQLEGYKNSTGANDTFFPDVDYYDYFMKEQSLYKKFSVEMNGGTRGVKYALEGGYIGGGGFEKLGEDTKLDRLNVRGNIDVTVTDYLTVVADVAARLEDRSWSAINNADFFSTLSTNYPNEYPLTIPAETLGLQPDSTGAPYFGTSVRKGGNLLSNLSYRGSTTERYVTAQTSLGVNFDFNKYVKGLTAEGYITFDNYTYMQNALARQYETYAPNTWLDAEGAMQSRFVRMQKSNLNDDITIVDNQTRRTSGWRANVGYENDFDLNHFSAILSYRYYKSEQSGASYDNINNNYNLRLNYDYGKRYLAEFSMAYMGSNKFAPGNRYCLSSAGGIGWVISNESFMEDVKQVNFLKLKAGYGVLGYVGAMDFNLLTTTWGDGGTITTGNNNGTTPHYTNINRIGNPNLKWEKSTELNIGAEALLLKNRLSMELDYFREIRSNIIGSNSSKYGAYLGAYTMQENMGKVSNQGFDGYISWTDKAGALGYSVGFNFVHSKNKVLEWNEVPFPDEGIRIIGKPSDAVFGLVSQGLFGRDVPMNEHQLQAFGPYGNGDLAYKDTNHDGIVDNRDQVMIGNSFPRTVLGLDVSLKYKNFGLYVLGTSELGINRLLDNTYYRNNRDSKYSALAWDCYHPERNPNGIYPILTTYKTNSFVNSDFWVENTSWFRLKNVEVSYTFPSKKQPDSGKGFKVYVRGTNLFVLSKVKDLDPEVPGAGVSNNPVTAYYTGGVSFTF